MSPEQQTPGYASQNPVMPAGLPPQNGIPQPAVAVVSPAPAEVAAPQNMPVTPLQSGIAGNYNPAAYPAVPAQPAALPTYQQASTTSYPQQPIYPNQPPQAPLPAYAQPQVATKASSDEKKAMIFGSIGIAIFVIGLFIGIAALAGAVCGAFAIRYAKATRYIPGITIGIIAFVINLAFYALAVFVK